MAVKGEELMRPDVELKGVSATDVTDTIIVYLENVEQERLRGAQRRDGGARMRLTSFLKRWHEANNSEETERLKGIIDKHFGTDFLGR